MIQLDTHVVVWLYAGRSDLLPSRVRKAIEENDIFASPAVLLELTYLNEIGRVTATGSVIVESLAATIGLTISDAPFRSVVTEAMLLDWTRDPFDRLIVGQARAEKARLITKDKIIRRHYRPAFWS